MIVSTMQDDFQLTVPAILQHGRTVFRNSEVVTWLGDSSRRATFADVAANAERLANALTALGVGTGDRVGTLCWNSQEHLEAYFAVPSMGAVLHTLNLRLPPGQLAHIINHAEDKVVIVDATLLPLLAAVASQLKTVEHFVLIGEGDTSVLGGEVPVHSYTSLVAAAEPTYTWPELDEKSPAAMCYTSGTTGDPKGVVYSHRSTFLHALATLATTVTGVNERDRALVVVPMFHVNAWGIPYSAPLVGAKLVLPGAGLDGASLYELCEQEKVDCSSGVPTVWFNLIAYLQEHGRKLTTLKRTIIGGAACPPAMIRILRDDYGITVTHGWGMTEMSPIGTINNPKARHAGLDADEAIALASKQGRPLFGVDMKLVDAEGAELPHDGRAAGNLLVRGPWVLARYYREDGAGPLTSDGWLPTGDVGTIDADGYLTITDRSKDMIKSGGEWISSIELENIAMGHPAVAEAAVIGVRHPRWDERPLLVVVRRAGAAVDRGALLAYYEGKVAKWARPDDVVFVDELPHTATGKLSKRTLRERYRDYVLPQ